MLLLLNVNASKIHPSVFISAFIVSAFLDLVRAVNRIKDFDFLKVSQ